MVIHHAFDGPSIIIGFVIFGLAEAAVVLYFKRK